VKIRNEAVHPTLGTPRNGQREALGPRIADTEGAGFCRPVTRELRNRGVRDTPIAAVEAFDAECARRGRLAPGSSQRPCDHRAGQAGTEHADHHNHHATRDANRFSGGA